MKFRPFLLGTSLCLGLSLTPSQAGETNSNDTISRQIQALQERFDQQQRELRELIRNQQQEIESLKRQMAGPSTNLIAPSTTNSSPSLAASPTNSPPAASQKEVNDLKQRVDQLSAAAKRNPINQFNPGMGVAIDSIFSYTSRGQAAAGLDRPGGFDAFLRTAELNLEASVDPFARAYSVIAASADAQTGEAALNVEEASIVTTSLPWNLTVQGGRFFGEFGRLSYVHDHDLPFVTRPLVLDRYVGGESQSDGFQVNYLFPTEHYLSLTVGVGDHFGGDLGPNGVSGYRSIGEVNSWGRLSSYFDLTDNLNLETGVSGLVDSSADGVGSDPAQRDRYIAAADLTLRYQPLGSSVYQGWTWGTEVLRNSARFETTPGLLQQQESWGLYSYLEKKLNRQFKVGFLFDWFEDPANNSIETFRYSPYVSWNPSEFQLLRLQYSHTEPNSASGLKNSEAIYLQWSAILGRHVHGFKQR
jgi:hypothetical protein